MGDRIPASHYSLYYPVIYDRDLMEVLTALGMSVVWGDGSTHVFGMQIQEPWNATVVSQVLREDTGKKHHKVEFFLTRSDIHNARIGPIIATDSSQMLRRFGAKVMEELFESVDDVRPFLCPTCGAGWLSYNGQKNAGGHPLVSCSRCHWEGRTTAFEPFRELK